MNKKNSLFLCFYFYKLLFNVNENLLFITSTKNCKCVLLFLKMFYREWRFRGTSFSIYTNLRRVEAAT